MREIKFRAWDTYKKIWTEYKIHEGIVFFLDKNTGVWVGKYDEGYKEFDLMQYTGLRDKNDTEIYDGDIVIHHSRIHKIIFNAEEARFVLRDDEFELEIPFTNNNSKKLEIVGNIYENPELLGDKNDF